MLHVLHYSIRQTLEGVSADQASEIELRTAIEFSVMAVLAPWASILSVHDITITSTNTACPGRRSAERRLVSGAVVSYTVTAKGSSTPEDIAAQLGKSLVNGEYLKVLRESSNLDIISITAFSAVNLNLSPTEPPSDSSSSTSSSSSSNESGI